ncbi:hypothetical protein LMTR13_21025 [Bradyrhizobium icense]|uniref:Uncharacterized protein n=1 Tax=Bradyrhizobium icense TaxID=1274631 RepID=A0A1B1UHP3_9BRAD|nr:hypothetical protein LMTR13_21025 [Bradyrhizobium icense]
MGRRRRKLSAAEAEAEAMPADTRAVMAGVADGAIMAEVMASMARPSLFARVRAATGIPTASASAGGDLGAIVVASGGSETRFRRAGQPARLALLEH